MEKICEIKMVSVSDTFGLFRQPQPYIGMVCKAPNGRLFIYERPPSFEGNYKFQHLHVICDEEIVTGDFYYNQRLKQIGQCDMDITPEMCKAFGYAKVISTTNKSLAICRNSDHDGGTPCNCTKLTQLPESFISQYIASCDLIRPITKVVVDFEEVSIVKELGDTSRIMLMPKTNDSNEISIRPYITEAITPIAPPQKYMGWSMRRVIFQYDDVTEYTKAYESLKAQGLDVSVVFGLTLALSVKAVDIDFVELAKK